MCPVCNHPKLFNLSDHLSKVHGIKEQERKYWLSKAPFSTISSHAVRAHSSVPQSDSTPVQCRYAVPKTSPLPKQSKLPNPIPPNSTSDENEDKLIPCPYDSCISSERVCGTNVPVMDYDIFKLHHPFCMLVAGARGGGKSELIKQLLSLKCYIMINPPERIVCFYGGHQPDLFCSLTQEIPCIEFYEGLPLNIKVMFDRSK